MLDISHQIRIHVASSAGTNDSAGRVSVCIPSHNSSRYIGKTIRSVLNSTYVNLEIIVNDNASTDRTREVVEAFGDDRIRFYQNKSNLGPVENWNRALKRSTGEFAGLLYSDDLYGPFWLTWAINVLKKSSHIGWVATAYRIVNDRDEELGVVSNFPKTREYSLREAFWCVSKLDGLGTGIVARREILEDLRYYDVKAGYSADNDLLLRLASKYPMYYSSYPHTSYRMHSNSLSRKWGVVQQATEGFMQLAKVFSDVDLPEELGELEADVYACFYRKVLVGYQRSVDRGDYETAEQLMRLLRANGYGD